jgi:hypothetical protein
MPTTLLRRFLDRFRSDEPDEEGSEGRFVPSPLDMSVRYGHGADGSEARREIEDIQEQAENRRRR